MSKIYTSADQLTGHTPLLELTHLEQDYRLEARLLAKLEYFNPAGSVKDRVAKAMLDDAEARGALKPGAVIIEPTSGNTGIGLASVAAPRGYRSIIVMPDAELARELPGSFIPGQFVNPANAQAHYRTTGPEIWQDTDGQVDLFVAGVGTGGTITGVGRYLKEQNPAVRIVAVEPAGSPVLSGGKAGPHKIQGIGGGFVPEVLDTGIYNEIIQVADEDAFALGRQIGRREGVLVGISAGAAAWAAVELAKRPENRGKTIVALLPDTGDRYLSTPMFAD